MLARIDDESDPGPRSAERERLCIATRSVRPVEELLRFVVAPDGAVVPDLKRKLPGRGVWVTATRTALAEAIARKAFARAFRRDVKVPSDLSDLVDRLMERRALDALAIGQKAGGLVCGFTQVEAALGSAPVVALIHAADAARDGVRKLAAAQRSAELGSSAVIDLFSSEQLGLALGRPNVIHAALLAGAASKGVLDRCLALQRFRGDDGNVGKGGGLPYRKAAGAE
jgi:hypothetical protein